jgi:hypothetical protein
LFWFINFENKSSNYLQLEYVTPTAGQTIQVAEIMDPIDSMVGFVLPERFTQKKTEFLQQVPMVEPRRKS